MNAMTKNSLMLAMDTSTASMTAAVLSGSKLLGRKSSHVERNHSMYLIPAVQELLKELNLKPMEIGIITSGHGPGSYTGVRIGITVAKTMAWSIGCPVVGVSSLEAIALGVAFEGNPATGVVGSTDQEHGPSGDDSDSEGSTNAGKSPVWFVPLMDARRTQAYTALFACGGGDDLTHPDKGVPQSWSRLEQDGNRPIEEWVDQLLRRLETAEVRPGRIVFAGETEPAAFQLAVTRLSQSWSGKTSLLPYNLDAYYTGLLGLQRLQAGETDDVHRLVPNYTQLAEAEVKLLAKQQG